MSFVCNCLINQSAVDLCQSIDFTSARVGIALSIGVILVAMKINDYTKQSRIVPINQQTQTSQGRLPQEELPISKLDFAGMLEHFSGMRNWDTTANKEAFRAEWGNLFNGFPPVERARIAGALTQEAFELFQFANSFQNEDGQDLAKVFIQNPLSSHWQIPQDKALDLHGFLVKNALKYCHREQLVQIAERPENAVVIDSPKELEVEKGKEEWVREKPAVVEKQSAEPKEPVQVKEQIPGMVEVTSNDHAE